MSSQLQPPSLFCFFVFNPTLGNEETESRKLLYFYPPSTPMNAQKDHVGLIEGLLAFTSDLSPTSPLSAVRSDEMLYGAIECEPSYFMALAVTHPALVSRVKGGERRVEWLVDDIDDEAIPSLLRLTYRTFRLFNDSFTANAVAHPMDALRARLDLFLRFLLPTLPIASLHSAPLLSGFHFLPVDKATFLTIQFLINHTQATFPAVQHMAVLSECKLIYTSLAGEDMEVLYALLDDHLPLFSYLAINEELSTRIDEAAAAEGAGKPGTGRGGERGGELSDGDAFAIPPSLYEEMGVKGYRGSGPAETTAADFLSTPPPKAKAKGPAGLPRPKRSESDGKGGGGAVTSPKQEGGAPVGFLTGPYRSPLPAALLPHTTGPWSSLNSPMWTSPLPLTLEDRACVNSPRVFLHTASDGQGEERPQEDERKEEAGVGGHRLVVYQRQSITLCFIVASLPSSPSSPSTTNHPPLSFYDTLESFIHSTLKKLAAALAASPSPTPSTSSSPIPALSSSASSAVSPSASASVESSYRFMYFNQMNLALKCTWESRGGALASEVMRVLREMREGMKKRKGGGESVVRVKGHGWVVGRCAGASHREFYLLLDEKVLSMADVEREMEQLTRLYFYNVAMA